METHVIRRHLNALVALAAVAAVTAVAALAVVGCAGNHASAASTHTGAVSTTGYSFAAYGDIRPDSSALNAGYGPGFRHVIAKLGSMPHAFDVVMGDIIQNASGGASLAETKTKYDNMFSQLGPDARFPHVWVVGNHEGVQTKAGAAAFAAKLHPGPRWYTYSYGSGTATQPRVLVIVLSTEEPGLAGRIGYYGEGDSRNSAQANFLVDTLRAHANDPYTYLVVAMHRPIADPKPGESFDVNGERIPLEHLFAKYGVDLVLDGHIHAYVRHDMPNSQPYMTIGTGGSPLYGPRSTVGTSPGVDKSRVFDHYGFTMFHMSGGGTLVGTTYSVDPPTWRWHVSDTFSVPQQQPTG